MKRVVSLLLAALLLISALTVFSTAASISDFDDIKEGAWYYDAVDYVISNGIMSGISDTKFDPNGVMTRAMFVVVLGKVAGADVSAYTTSSFTDVDTNKLSWAYKYIEWAKDNKIVSGTGEGLFSPNAPVTREQMATFFYRYAQYAGYKTDGFDENCFKRFVDASEAGSYAYAPLIWATYFGIIGGTGIVNGGPTLAPKLSATRATVAVVIRGFNNTRFDTSTPVGTITVGGEDLLSYNIVYAPGMKEAADYLNGYINKTIGASLPVQSDAEAAVSDKEILIGQTNREGDGLIVDRSGLDSQGYVVCVENGKVILSESLTGDIDDVKHAIKRFLKEAIGWRFYNFGEYIDGHRNTVDIPNGFSVNGNQDIKYALPFWNGSLSKSVNTDQGVWDGKPSSNNYYFSTGEFSHGNRVHTLPVMNQDWRQKDESGNPIVDEKGNYVYMTAKQITRAIEKTGWGNGSEMFKNDDPCLSDETVINNIVVAARAWCENNKHDRWFYITQGDGTGFCKCEKCMAAYREDGSYSSMYVRIINKLCEELSDEYPDVYFATLAYKHTQIAPRVTKMHPNGMVIVCTDSWCTSHAIDDPNCAVNASYKKSLDSWAEVCKDGQLFVWDYWAHHQFAIVPNLYQHAQTYAYFAKVGVDGYVMQGNNHMMGDASYYMLSLFNDDYYTDAADYRNDLDGYLSHFYGYGWTYIREFADKAAEVTSNHHYWSWSASPDQFTYANEFYENKDYFTSLLDRAYELASYDFQKQQIDILRLTIWYSELLYGYEAGIENGGGKMFNLGGTLVDYYEYVNAFISRVDELGVGSLLSPDAIMSSSNRIWSGKHPALWSYSY